MGVRRKGLVFVPDKSVVVRFLGQGNFAALAREFDLTMVLPSDAGVSRFSLEAEQTDGMPAIHLDIDSGRENAWNMLFNLSAFAFIARSRTFAIRVRGLYSGWWPSTRLFRQGPRGVLRYFWRIALLLSRQPKYWGYRVVALPFIFPLLRQAIISRLGCDPATIGLLTTEKPDFIIVLSSIHDAFSHDVVRVAGACRVPSILLQGNWDNVASKGVMFFQPDRLAVWAEQSRQEAITVQRMPPERIRIVGAAQFESFRRPPLLSREDFMAEAGVPSDRPLVVFAGNARGFDEMSALALLERAINDGRLPPMTIVYRPHPWTRKPYLSVIPTMGWRNIVIDPETRAAHQGTARQYGAVRNFHYSFDYLNTLYSHASALIVPYSTAILECMIKGVPVVCVAYSDGDSHWGPHITAQMAHCQDLFGKAGVFRCDSEDDLVEQTRRAILMHGDPASRDAIRRDANFFADFSLRPYGERLAEIVNETLCAT